MLRNTLWNLLGEGLPMLAALLSIPWLIAAVGMERFGALTLIWALLGYLGVLDLGLGRSLVQVVAERIGHQDGPGGDAGDGRAHGTAHGTAGIAGPAIALMAGIGLVTGGAVALGAGLLADRFQLDTGTSPEEIRLSLLVAAAIVPIALLSAGLRGVLEAHQRFRPISLVRMTVGVLNYLSPLFVLPFSHSLVPVIAAIAVGRFAGLVGYGVLAVRLVPDLLHPGRWGRPSLRGLFTMSAWMMLNNLVGPAMLYADRFILLSLVPAAMVAFYTTPFELLSRLMVIPGALSLALFPLASSLFRRDPPALGRILDAGGHLTLAVFLAMQAATIVGGETALELWLGPAFAANSAAVLSILMLGVFFNATAYVPNTLIQSVGRVDVTARLQLVELPVYLGVLWLLAERYGAVGAAAAWSLRTAVDCGLLLVLLPRLAPGTGMVALTIGLRALLAGAAGLAGLLVGGPVGAAISLTGLVAVGLGVAGRLLRTRSWERLAGPLRKRRAPPIDRAIDGRAIDGAAADRP
ncbi:flippase [Azospirillum sp. TSO35-2]|uniref:flippase n=1 Tax=Azospirillum sp. TSO35-2 TaxID=716796 RepID=UPI001FFE4196|nr:flippase [Azospirillum sp. TSO35-2]